MITRIISPTREESMYLLLWITLRYIVYKSSTPCRTNFEALNPKFETNLKFQINKRRKKCERNAWNKLSSKGSETMIGGVPPREPGAANKDTWRPFALAHDAHASTRVVFGWEEYLLASRANGCEPKAPNRNTKRSRRGPMTVGKPA